MNHHYGDIRRLSSTPPIWFDENAVPRFCEFSPDEGADIYAKEIVLLRVDCQDCGHQFRVAMSWNETSQILRGFAPLSKNIKSLHYGDPPNIECCPSGPTMNSEPRRTIEFWRREHGDWARVPELEGVVLDEEEGT